MKKFFSFICSLLVSCLLFSSCTPPTGASESSFSSTFESRSSASSIINSTENAGNPSSNSNETSFENEESSSDNESSSANEENSSNNDENSSENEAPSTPPDDGEKLPTGEIDFSQLTYTALGDSITASDGKKPYSTTVKEILGLKNGINNGIGGTTVSNRNNGFVDRYDSMSIYSDIISIQGGINDCRLDVELGTIDNFDETTFMGAYNSLIKKIKEKYPDAFIFLMSMPKTYNSITLDMYVNGNGCGYNYLDYASAVYEVANKWKLPVLDWYIDSFCEDTKETDGVHPSQTYISETLAPMIAQFIKDNYTPPIDFSDKTMACLGDSITYGFVTKQGGQYENPYPKLLKESLGLKECYNYGKGGSNLATYNNGIKPFTERVKELPSNLDIISVMGGTNDWVNSVPLGTIDSEEDTTVYGALRSIADYLTENYPHAYIVFMSPLPIRQSKTNSQGYKMFDVGVAVREVAELYGFGFLDMYSLSGFENEMNTDSTDGCHPSQELLINSITPLIAQFIKDNYKEKRAS